MILDVSIHFVFFSAAKYSLDKVSFSLALSDNSETCAQYRRVTFSRALYDHIMTKIVSHSKRFLTKKFGLDIIFFFFWMSNDYS